MADAKMFPIVLWAITVLLTYFTSQSFGLTAGVAFLAGATAFAAYLVGRDNGPPQAERAPRRIRGASQQGTAPNGDARMATGDHARTIGAMADEAERELRELVEARPGWTVHVDAKTAGGCLVEVRRDGRAVRTWSDRRRLEAVTKARDEVQSNF